MFLNYLRTQQQQKAEIAFVKSRIIEKNSKNADGGKGWARTANSRSNYITSINLFFIAAQESERENLLLFAYKHALAQVNLGHQSLWRLRLVNRILFYEKSELFCGLNYN